MITSLYVGRFENKNGIIYQTIDDNVLKNLPTPNGKPFDHAYGKLLVVFKVPDNVRAEAIFRAKKGWLNDQVVWEYKGVQQ